MRDINASALYHRNEEIFTLKLDKCTLCELIEKHALNN